MDKLKLVKITVFFMTMLLVAGVGAIIYGLANKDKSKPASTNAPARISKALLAPNDILIDEPMGSSISKITPCGNNLCVLLTGGGQPNRIFIFDEQGKQTGSIKLKNF